MIVKQALLLHLKRAGAKALKEGISADVRGNEDERMLSLLTGDVAAQGGGMIMIVYLVLIVGFFYFFLMRPQKKEQKSGFYGVVIDITDDTVIVEFGNNKNCRIPMKKEAIADVEKA